MDTREEIADSPNEWVAQHIRQYVETNGRARPGMIDLLLTTRGRKSGTLRRTALVHVREATSREIPVVIIEPTD